MPPPFQFTFFSYPDLEAFIERTVKAAESRMTATILREVRQLGAKIMGEFDVLREEQAKALALVAEMAPAIGEIGSDLDALIAKLAAGTPGSAEVAAATADAQALTARLTEVSEALKGAAAKFTPEAAPEA